MRPKVATPEERALVAKLDEVPIEHVLQWLGLPVTLEGLSEVKTRCPDPKRGHANADSNPSLTVNRDGRFYCFVCGYGGRGIVSLACQHTKQTRQTLLPVLCDQFVHKIVPDAAVQEMHKNLLADGVKLGDLYRMRGVTPETVTARLLGLDSGIITIPVRGPYGFWMDLRRWNAFRLSGVPKNLPYDDGYGVGSHGKWWPADVWAASSVWVCEGEPDTLRALASGKMAATVIGGCTAFEKADWSVALGRSVTITAHADEPGHDAAERSAALAVKGGARRVRVVRVPTNRKDLDLWVAEDGWPKVMRVVNRTAWRQGGEQALAIVPLEKAVLPSLEGVPVSLDGQIATVQAQPHIVPKTFRVTCHGDAGLPCLSCPQSFKSLAGIYEIRPQDVEFLEAMSAGRRGLKDVMRASAKIPEMCRSDVNYDVVESQAALPVRLIPSAHRSGRDVTHVTREAILAGHHIPPGTTAKFRAVMRVHPKTNLAIPILTDVLAGLSPHKDFVLSDGMGETIRALYADKDPYDAAVWTAEAIAKHYTRVAGRTAMHVAMDLVFHSLLEIPYGGIVEPGFLDVLVFGATSTGKGHTAEGLVHLYDLGEVISSKRCSTAGLIGGSIRHNNGFDVAPGAWPLQHGGLCIMDEAIQPEIFSALTRARREGVGEFTHAGVSQSMPAKVRKVWLMNPPSGKTLDDYRYGAELIRELGGTEEDTTRWDLAVGVAGDVTPEAIDEAAQPLTSEPEIDRDILRAKARFAWSRLPENVRWAQGARRALRAGTTRIVRTFSSMRVGLIQPGNTSAKLRKLSAAMAALVFATPDDVTLVIEAKHVEAAERVMREALSDPVVALDQRTETERAAGDMGDEQAILAAIRRATGEKYQDTLRQMVLLGSAPLRAWQAIFPNGNQEALDTLLRERALVIRSRDQVDATRPFADLVRRELRVKLKRRDR